MRYAIFSDIHSNLESLQAVIADAEKCRVQRYVCLGDIVGYNADPLACLELVQSLDCPVIKGNHDEAAAINGDPVNFNPIALEGIRFTREAINSEAINYLNQLPLTLGFRGFTAVHSSMHQPQAWQYVISEPEVWQCLHFQPGRLCFIGHTHEPMIYSQSQVGIKIVDFKPSNPILVSTLTKKKCLINVGSVGQPRDGDWRSSYVIYDESDESIEFRRVEYDVKKTQEKILTAGLPMVLAERLTSGW